MTEEEFRSAVQDLLARPVAGLSPEAKSAVVQGCIGKASGSSRWSSPELLGQLWMIGLPFLALLTRLDWWALSIIWVLAVTSFFLATIFLAAGPREAGASPRLTEDELRSAVHFLLAQPVNDLRVEDKADVIRACLAGMKQKEQTPWWSRVVNSLPNHLLPFTGVATMAVLFPGIAWFLWLLLGILFGVLVALLLALVFRGVRWLVKPAAMQPSESALGEQAVEPGVEA
jgi:hypothetical protein